MLLWGVCGDRMKGYGEAEKGGGGGEWVTGGAHESIDRDSMGTICVSATSDHSFLPQGQGIEFLGRAKSAYAGDFLVGGFGLLLLLR